MKKIFLLLIITLVSCIKSDSSEHNAHDSLAAKAFLDKFDEVIWEANEPNELGVLGLMFQSVPQQARLAMGSFDDTNQPIFDKCDLLLFGETANIVGGDLHSITLVSSDSEGDLAGIKLIIHINANMLTMRFERFLLSRTIYMTKNDALTASSFCI